jgi:hypothetical protein
MTRPKRPAFRNGRAIVGRRATGAAVPWRWPTGAQLRSTAGIAIGAERIGEIERLGGSG